MGALILKRLPASTLLEVVISMVIIMAVFVVSMGIYTKVTLSGLPLSKIEAQQQMKKIISESMENKDWENMVITANSINYRKTVSPYAGYTDLLLISVEANQQGKSLGSLKQVLKIQGHENQR